MAYENMKGHIFLSIENLWLQYHFMYNSIHISVCDYHQSNQVFMGKLIHNFQLKDPRNNLKMY